MDFGSLSGADPGQPSLVVRGLTCQYLAEKNENVAISVLTFWIQLEYIIYHMKIGTLLPDFDKKQWVANLPDFDGNKLKRIGSKPTGLSTWSKAA